MYEDVLTYLEPQSKSVVFDCTLGVGSHALKILERMKKDAIYVGIDKDATSLKVARHRLHKYGKRCCFVKDDFRNIDAVVSKLELRPDAFLFDLGISSYQLEDPHRGFSFVHEGPLDMRMDRESFLCACDLINNLSEKELASVFKKFGEERYSYRIAHTIVQQRDRSPFATTSQLKEAVTKAIPHRGSLRMHPATRIFMALRIVVNRELDSLREGLCSAIEALQPGGRIVVISFHSLAVFALSLCLKRLLSRYQAGKSYFPAPTRQPYISWFS